MLLEGLRITILFLIIPMLLGCGMAKIIHVYEKPSFSGILFRYVVGQIMMWAVFELIGVPLIYMKRSFRSAVVIWCICILIIVVLEIVYIVWRRKKESCETGQEPMDAGILVLALIAFGLIGLQCYQYVFRMHLDKDDSRYIVNAVEAYENDQMLVNNPATGDAYTYEQSSSVAKDTASPWMIYTALMAELVGIHPTILAHTILPVILLGMSYMIFWLIGEALFGAGIFEKLFFVIFIAWINMFFCNTTHTQSTVTLVRIWQGKAVVAAVAIPMLLYTLLLLYHARGEASNGRIYILLTVVSLGSCLLSGMGIFFAGIMTGVYGLWYVIVSRRWKELVGVCVACIPTLIYGMIYAGLL